MIVLERSLRFTGATRPPHHSKHVLYDRQAAETCEEVAGRRLAAGKCGSHQGNVLEISDTLGLKWLQIAMRLLTDQILVNTDWTPFCNGRNSRFTVF